MVKWVVKTVQTYPYSNCTFHHQNSQRVQTSFTLPTNLGKALANIIHCTCFFQHVLKQDRIHARTNMGKIALCKLFAGILCGCRVLLVLVVKWVKKPSNYVYILTALFSTRFNKEFKQVLPYQPWESLGQHNRLYLFLSACCKTKQNPCKNKHEKKSLQNLLLVFCVVAWCCWCCWCCWWWWCWWWSEWWQPSKHIHILIALFITRIHKEFKQVLPYQPTSGKPWPT